MDGVCFRFIKVIVRPRALFKSRFYFYLAPYPKLILFYFYLGLLLIIQIFHDALPYTFRTDF